MTKGKLQQITEAAKQLGWTVGSGVTVPTYLEQLERENLKLLADNAALLETIRLLRLDIETYKSTLEGLKRRADKLEKLGIGGWVP